MLVLEQYMQKQKSNSYSTLFTHASKSHLRILTAGGNLRLNEKEMNPLDRIHIFIIKSLGWKLSDHLCSTNNDSR